MSNNHFRVSNAFQLGLLGGLGVLTAVLIGNALVTLATVLTYIAAAIFIALGLDPVVNYLESKKLPRPAAIAIVVVGLLSLLGIIAGALAPALFREAANFIKIAPNILSSFEKLPWVMTLDSRFGGSITDALNSLKTYLVDSSHWAQLLGGVVQVSVTIFNGFVGGLIIIILSLYFMASLSSFKRWVYTLVPLSQRAKFVDISDQVADAIGRYVIGQVSVAFFNAALGLIATSIIGVPYAIVIAAIAFVLAMIPLVGSLSIAVIATLIALSASPTTALITAIYYLIYMQVEAYIISPRIMKRAVSVPGAVVVVAALAGGALLGVMGALVAIPVAASIMLILRQVVAPRQQER
jgi:predicted PurR-regulated permease PerM